MVRKEPINAITRPKYGTKTATAIVERTRAVRIRIEHDRYSTESGLCGNSSSKLCATGFIVNAYLVKGLTTVVQTAILEAKNCPGRLRVICDAVASPNMVKPITATPA